MAITRSCVGSWGYVIIVGKFMQQFIDTGIAKSFGVLIPTMVKRLDSDYATVGFICSMPATLMLLFSPFVTLVLRRLNNRCVAVAGGLLTGSCLLAFASIKNVFAATVCLALSGLGLSSTLVSLMLALNDFFPERFNFVNTFTLYGFTAGSIIVPIVIERAFEAYGYNGAFVILGGISLNLVVCGVIVRKPSRNVDSERNTPISYEKKETIEQSCLNQNRKDLQRGLDLRGKANRFSITYLFQTCKESCGLLNEPLFLFSLPIHFCTNYTTYAWMLFLVPHAEQLGMAQSRAVFLSTIGGVGGVIGRTIFILLIGKGVNAFLIYIAISILCTSSFLLDFTSSVYKVRAALAFVQGFCLFIEDTLAVALSKDAVLDERNFDMAISASYFLGGVGAMCAGVFTGYIFDVTQSFTKVFIMIGFIHAVTVVLLIIVAILLKKRQ